MKKIYLKLILSGVFVLLICAAASAQTTVIVKNTTGKVLSAAGKTTIKIVGETAKAAYEITKFTVKNVGAPAAKGVLKPLVLKAAPQTSVFLLKQTGNVIKRSLPVGQKLLMTYLKTRISI